MLGADEIRELYPDQYYGEPGVKFQPLIERLVRIVGARHMDSCRADSRRARACWTWDAVAA
jgi:hypothetical protein